MSELTPEQIEEQKRYIYEKLSQRRRKFVDRIGYDTWDPFQKPFDPIDIRKEVTGRTSHELTTMFLSDRGKKPTQEYTQAISEFTLLLVMNSERVRPVFEFCLWYAKHLEKHGKQL